MPGRVKTRLARHIGNEAAAALASAMLRDVWSTVNACGIGLPVLAAAEPGAFPVAVDCDGIWMQAGHELGARIHGILARALSISNSAIALGADSPLVTEQHLRDAVAALQTHDAVLGPCSDGGFYLLGVRYCPDALFDGVPWSCSVTCEGMLRRLALHSMSVVQLETLGDVDTLEDLPWLQQELEAAPETLAPATRQWLSDQRLL